MQQTGLVTPRAVRKTARSSKVQVKREGNTPVAKRSLSRKLDSAATPSPRASSSFKVKTGSSSASPSSPEVSCSICLDDLRTPGPPLSCCSEHRYHAKCLQAWILTKLGENHVEIHCPACTKPTHISSRTRSNARPADDVAAAPPAVLSDADVRAYLRAGVRAGKARQHEDLYERACVNRAMHDGVIKPCNTPGCDWAFFIDQASEACLTKSGKPSRAQYSCDACGRNPLAEQEMDEASAALCQELNYRRCPRCDLPIDKYFGCNHLHCRCGHEWCFGCGYAYHECKCHTGLPVPPPPRPATPFKGRVRRPTLPAWRKAMLNQHDDDSSSSTGRTTGKRKRGT